MKLTLGLTTLAGLALLTGLIVHQGAGVVFAALAATGWGLAVVVAFHAVPLACSALGWRALTEPRWRQAPLAMGGVRAIREAIDNLLPVAQVGGEIVGARLLTLRGVPVAVAGASIVLDMTMEVVTLIAFTLLGLGLLMVNGQGDGLVGWMLLGLAVAGASVGGFVVAQNAGLFKLVDWLIAKLAASWNLPAYGGMAGLHEAVRASYARHGALAASAGWHMLSWITGAGEIWLVLHFMGTPISGVDALVLESLGHAVRSAAFPVPGALGVQEGGYMLLGAMVGLGPETGLALSLAKRVRELALGVPGLIAWQVVEGRRLLRARQTQL